MEIPTICRYCGGRVELTDSGVIHGISYGNIYLCLNCNAYTGVHENSVNPKGTLANAVLRQKRRDAHKAFDRYWREHKMSRSQGYSWLSQKLGIPKSKTHIGYFEIEACEKVIKLCKAQSANAA